MIQLENKLIITEEDKEYALVKQVVNIFNRTLFGKIEILIRDGCDVTITSSKSEKLLLKDKK